MNLFKSIVISFSMYSKIPMPSFEWDEDNYRHAIAFLPIVGAVIGALCLAVLGISGAIELPVFVLTVILTLIPLFVTGGFHVDGFMDVQDALCSYQPREKKLEIMKDPHIGGFAVMGAGILALVWTGSLYLMVQRAVDSGMTGILKASFGCFMLSRAVCGITSIVFSNAKKDGMLAMETGKSGALDVSILAVFGVAAAGYMLYMDMISGICCIAALVLFTFWYKHKCHREFGGVTGDTAGFFVVTSQALMLAVLATVSAVLL